MGIDRNELQRLEKLARFDIDSEKKDWILRMINEDIEMVKDIDKVDTDELEGLVNPYDMRLETRADEVSDGNKQKEIMKCAKKSMYNYFVAPKVLDNN
ncbi:MAG: Asp-tRNA(Asn)/Glu-tRNA(Gln) amidotransferase subunit GatC [Rickettsiales bacterium]|jgi:aspartyl/glutamyl-tRNA(Asn/Gln) amidotransferase C subunit|nr:Asp-tRNA(Asn)/Glu-tRNA(Gln) amidotransferase subunit GatC [Rickettsiales bacterium]